MDSHAERGAELGPQDLQRDPPAVLQVFGEVDRGHPAPAELALDPVAVGKGRTEMNEEIQDSGSEGAAFPSQINAPATAILVTSLLVLGATVA